MGRGNSNPRVEERAPGVDDLDALFRELDEKPAAVSAERRRRTTERAGRLFLVTGVALVGGGFLTALILRDPGSFLTLFLTVNVAAVLCIAAGALLLPEKSGPHGSTRL